MGGKTRVAILGGGVGAISAAYQLTSFPDWQDRFDITVYQMGWRLGGKCASGRNAAQAQRIEEHGLHVWQGFYDNAIRQMRDCYTHAAPLGGVFRSFREAFEPFNRITLTERIEGQWLKWFIEPPRNAAEAGSGGMLLTPWEYCAQALAMLSRMFDHLPERDTTLRPVTHESLVEPRAWPARAAKPVSRLEHLLDFFAHLPRLPGRLALAPQRALLGMLDGLVDELRAGLATRQDGSHERRRFLIAADLVIAAIRGVIEDQVITRGFEVIDDEEISAWLRKHGASDESLDSALVRGIYDYAFGFSGGVTDPAHRAIAAGTSLRGLCRMSFTYKDSYFFKMRGGMGDTVFVPYYKVLQARGVKFRFFHKVTAIEADTAGTGIQHVKLTRQADLAADTYDALVPVEGPGGLIFDCWPSTPRWEQLRQGGELRDRGIDLESAWADWPGVGSQELRRGVDFDQVILGIPVGALREICTDLRRDPRWEDMLDKLQTTRTLACQLWFKDDLDDLGWDHGPTILSAYQDRFDTWADMTHLLPLERWPRAQRVKSLAYLCGSLDDDPLLPPYSDHDYPRRERERVRGLARQWVEQHAGFLWPELLDAQGQVRWDRLQCLDPAAGIDAFDAQYFRANIDPSERYVLSVPGSTQYRLRSDASGFDNLFLAGDWTDNGVNAGCVEAAVMSGMRAAAGLAGEVLEIVGESDRAEAPAENRLRPADLVSLRAQNQAWPWSAMYGMAQTRGANAVFALPREVVSKMLPVGLQLAAQGMTMDDEHPVLLLFGWQDDVRPNGFALGGRYMEFILSVPFVQHADPRQHARCPGPFIYMPQLYLDALLPTLLGVFGYGYNKKLAHIVADDQDYTVCDRHTRETLISASFRPCGPPGTEVDFEHFRITRLPYQLPLISRSPLGWHYSFYDFALGQAVIRPIDMTIKVYSDKVGGLPSGIRKVPSIVKQPLGAFFVCTDATISHPLQTFVLPSQIKRRGAQGLPALLPFGRKPED